MTGVLAAALAGLGMYLIWTATALGWRGVGRGHGLGVAGGQPKTARLRIWLRPDGLGGAGTGELGLLVGVVTVVGGALGYLLFGGLIPAFIAAVFAGTFPMAAARARHLARLAEAREAWPRLLEELRLLTGSLGRSIPQALFDVGRRAPYEMRAAFAAAEREWLLTTDFERTLRLLRTELADATADVVCETLGVAHEIGGGSLDRRLTGLIEDRVQDVQARKDARSKQAGVRFARLFVLLVPLGMTIAGLSIGSGRAAYQSTGGQLAVTFGFIGIIACWLWSGRLLHLPEEPRVFAMDASENQPRDSHFFAASDRSNAVGDGLRVNAGGSADRPGWER
jgi:tight adherence protein B